MQLKNVDINYQGNCDNAVEELTTHRSRTSEQGSCRTYDQKANDIVTMQLKSLQPKAQ